MKNNHCLIIVVMLGFICISHAGPGMILLQTMYRAYQKMSAPQKQAPVRYMQNKVRLNGKSINEQQPQGRIKYHDVERARSSMGGSATVSSQSRHVSSNAGSGMNRGFYDLSRGEANKGFAELGQKSSQGGHRGLAEILNPVEKKPGIIQRHELYDLPVVSDNSDIKAGLAELSQLLSDPSVAIDEKVAELDAIIKQGSEFEVPGNHALNESIHAVIKAARVTKKHVINDANDAAAVSE